MQVVTQIPPLIRAYQCGSLWDSEVDPFPPCPSPKPCSRYSQQVRTGSPVECFCILLLTSVLSWLFTISAASSFQMFNAGPGPLSFSVAPSSRAVYAALGVGNDVPWGTVTPVYGVIPAQQSFTFALNASSLLLPPGSFGTTLVIHTNQPLGLLTPSVPVDQSISVSDGQVFSIPWSVQVVAAIAFPAQVNASLSPYQSVREVVSVANFAGTALVLLPSTTAVWVRTDDAVMIIPAGSVSSFSILLSYPLWSNGSVVNPGSNVTANITFGCWRADATKAASSSVSAPELASLLNVSASSLPGYPYFSPISLNVVTAAVSTVVGPPNATLSFAQLLTPPSVPVNVGPGVRIRLSIRDKAGYAVQPTDDVIGLVGLQFHYQVGDVLNGNSTALGSVVSIVPSADQSAFLITAQPLVLGVLLLSVTLNGSSVGAPLSVTVFTADCAVNETAVNGLICACSAGYFYNDSTHCLPCPAGSYKPVPGNGGRTS